MAKSSTSKTARDAAKSSSRQHSTRPGVGHLSAHTRKAPARLLGKSVAARHSAHTDAASGRATRLAAKPDRSGHFEYDAVKDTPRRKRICSRPLFSEDRELNARDRKTLTAGNRDLKRNFVIAGWMLRKHLDYITTFHFQSRNDDEQLNKSIEKLMEIWYEPDECDAAGRHSIPDMIRIDEERAFVDGDVGLLKLADGRLQGIEGDRVSTPKDAGNKKYDPKIWIHGIKVGPGGRALQYAVNRQGDTGPELEKIIPRENMEWHGYYDRFEQIRGVSPLAPAYNTFQDTYEGCTLALAKMKVAQYFALEIYRKNAEELGLGNGRGEEDEDDKGDSEARQEYEVDFGKGPVLMDMDPDDRMEFHESRTPSTETQAYLELMIAQAIKAADIPFTFYNVRGSTYSGARQDLLQYEMSAMIKRRRVRCLLDAITYWRLRLWILEGRLVLPDRMTVDDLQWEHIHAGIPWIDPLKEVEADVKAIEALLDSHSSVVKRRTGRDFGTLLEECARDKKLMTKLGLQFVGTSAAKTTTAGQDDPNADEPI